MKGSCLCGAIKYEVSQIDSPIEHCSCRTCRKAHAAAFNTVAAIELAHFRWIKGQEFLKAFESSPGKHRCFCSICGTQLVARLTDRGYLILRVATLDDDPQVKPQFQIWKSHEVSWLEYGPHIPAYNEWEPGHE